ncbi:MAG TPA: MBOAT family O-acyltransferase [Bryobacteraceae bacterium]
MAFNTAGFWAFFAIVLLVSAILHGRNRLRVLFLSAASFYFYYASNGYLTLLIVFATFFDFIAAKRIFASSVDAVKKRWMIASITSNLLILCVFKYSNLFLSTAAHAVNVLGFHVSVPTIGLLLPVGISFYTFEAISYVVDVYKGRVEPQKRWLSFNYFIVFFPKLTAGPIIRPKTFFDNVAKGYALSEAAFESSVQMIFLGLFQKVILADRFAPLADAVYGGTAAPDSFTTLAGIYAFSLQIYFDFVGYTNIAIGTAGLLGVALPDNFRRPYIATCLSDFWKRWHISLSTWLRDYLYIPIGGGRGSLLMTCRNLMITMTLGGLWHGASWNFAIWGALNGILLCMERVTGVEQRITALLANRGVLARAGWSFLTFNVFALLWVPFRAHTFGEFAGVLKRLFVVSLPRELRLYDLLVCLIAAAAVVCCVCDEQFDLSGRFARLHPLLRAPVFAGVIVASLAFSSEGNQPFIYFRF